MDGMQRLRIRKEQGPSVIPIVVPRTKHTIHPATKIISIAMSAISFSIAITATVLLSKRIGPPVAWKAVMGITYSIGALSLQTAVIVSCIDRHEKKGIRADEARDIRTGNFEKVLKLRDNLKLCLSCLDTRPELARRYREVRVFSQEDFSEITKNNSDEHLDTATASLLKLQAIEKKLYQFLSSDQNVHIATRQALRADDSRLALEYLGDLMQRDDLKANP